MTIDVCRLVKLPYFPDYKSHLNISRTTLFLPKIWGKFIDKSNLSISRTLFCYFLARRNVLGCIHVMRRSAKERQDAIDAWRIKPRWSRYHYCHLAAIAACSARDFRREFSHALPVRAVDGRQRERERDTAGWGGVVTRLQRQSDWVSDCEVLWVSWSWSSADRGTP